MADRLPETDTSPPAGTPVENGLAVLGDFFSAAANYIAGLSRYTTDFMVPYLIASHYFQRAETPRLADAPPAATLAAYLQLLDQNAALMRRGASGALAVAHRYHATELTAFMSMLEKPVWAADTGDVKRWIHRQVL